LIPATHAAPAAEPPIFGGCISGLLGRRANIVSSGASDDAVEF
jgi:hypothetical protein